MSAVCGHETTSFLASLALAAEEEEKRLGGGGVEGVVQVGSQLMLPLADLLVKLLTPGEPFVLCHRCSDALCHR